MGLNLKQKIPAVILFLLFFSLYIYTAAPGVYDGDSGEIAAAVNTLGLAHPTGFPLYMLSGKLFTLLVPIKDVAYRLNIFSALLTAAALVFVYYTLRNLGNSQLSSLAASFVLGLGRNTIWSNAGTTRVYALSLLFVSILFFIFSKWRKEQKMSYLYWYGFMWGLSLGTHSLMLVMGIPFLFMLWRALPIFKVKISILVKIILLTILPVVQYIYLLFAYKRNGIVTWGSMESVNDFIYYITQREYANKFFANDFSGFFSKLGGLLISEFTIIFFCVAIIGLVVLYRKDKNLLKLFITVAVANIGMLYIYGKPEDLIILQRYFFIAYLALAIAVAFGLDMVISQTGALKNKKCFMFFTLPMLLILFFQFEYAHSDNNRRNNYLVEDTAHNILGNLEPNSIILAHGDPITGPMWYLQSIGERQDVVVIATGLVRFDWYINNIVQKQKHLNVADPDLLGVKDPEARIAMLLEKNFLLRPTYVTFNDSSGGTLQREFDFTPQGLTYRITSKGLANTKEMVNSNKTIWNRYTLRNVKAGFYKDEMLNRLAIHYALALYEGGIAYYDNGFIDESIDALRKSLEIYPHPTTQKNFDYIKKKAADR